MIRNQRKTDPYGAIIFDIDRMVKRERVPEQNALEQELNRLHVAVWEVFALAQGENSKPF